MSDTPQQKKIFWYENSLAGIIIGTLMFFVILALILLFGLVKPEMFLAITALVVTVSAILISLVIAATQKIQLEQQKEEITNLSAIQNRIKETAEYTKKISEHTKETADKLETNSSIQNRVNRFFCLHGNFDTKFQLFFPVDYVSKPLPVINHGIFTLFMS
jgi:uncharacterized membrane protein (DUF106 family)